MSLLDKASLIVTPNAYKTSKLYSVVPSTGAGDMDVVRDTTATRVNSAGLIEVVPRNLLTYSNTFTNSAWIKNSCAISANSIISPDGTQNASKLVEGTTNDSHHIYQNAISSGQNTFTFYAKQGERKFVYAYADNVGQGKCFDLENGTLGVNIIAAPLNSSITSVGNGWYRCSITISMTTTALRIGACSANGTFSYLGNGTSGIYIYGAQLDASSTATTYFPTTTRLNIPRIDYTNGSCPSILLEPQRTNLLTYSNDFSNVIWSKVASSTVTTDSGVQNPSGVSPTFRFNASNLAFGGILRQILTLTVGQTYTFSYFAKKGNYRYIGIRFNNARNGERFPTYDFDTDTLNKQGATCDLSRTLLTNGWVKLTITFTATIITSNCDIALTTSNGDTSTALSGTEFVYVYGAQTELSSYPTSYIPTVASIQTRNADVISKTGISSLINSQAGTMFIEASALANNTTARFIELNETLSSLTNNVYFRYEPITNLVAFTVFSGSILQCNINYSLPLTQIANNKMAFVWALNRFEIWVNGSKVSEDTLGVPHVVSSLNKILFYDRNSANNFEGNLKSLQIYKEALSNTELQSLTTL